jgi:hypothetical protein
MEATIFSKPFNWLQRVVFQETELFGDYFFPTFAIESEAYPASYSVGSTCCGVRKRGLDAKSPHPCLDLYFHKDSENVLACTDIPLRFRNERAYTNTRGAWPWWRHNSVLSFSTLSTGTVTRGRAIATEISLGCPLSPWATAMYSYLCNRLWTLALKSLPFIIHTSLSLGTVHNTCSQQGINR